MNKAAQPIIVKVRDRVTFDTDEGIQVGYVNGLRRDIGNGELHAWIEVDHILPGCFRAVPVSDILTSDQVGPPSTFYIGADCGTCTLDVNTSSDRYYGPGPTRRDTYTANRLIASGDIE